MREVPYNERNELLNQLLSFILLAITAQTINIRLWGVWHGLAGSWVGSTLIVFGFACFVTRAWQKSSSMERQELCAPWLAPVPWVILGLLIVQVVLYQPTMNDSLSYRLPRIFSWLEEGRITPVQSSDFRINAMPWGWEAMAVPFASLNQLGWSRLINVCMWSLVYQVLFHWARVGGANRKSARWLAAALATAPGFLIQASSTANDFYALGLLLIGTHWVLQFGSKPAKAPVFLSLVALVLASSVKPQFLTLGACWGLWWMFGPQRPCKQLHWRKLALAAPLLLLISPIPHLLGNLCLGGSLLGASGGQASLIQAPASMKLLTGVIQFAFSQLQLPVMPYTETLKHAIQGFPGFSYLHDLVPKFTPGFAPVAMIDNASIGLIHTVAILLGVRLAWKQTPATFWLCLAAATGFLIAASQISVGSIGRSFMGFGALLLPVAAIGLARLRFPQSALVTGFAIVTGLVTLIVNPSSPLWPSQALEAHAATRGWNPIAAGLRTYNSYRERAETGKGILDPVPAGETVGAFFRSVTPLINLWQPDWRRHPIDLISGQELDAFLRSSTQWLVVGGKSIEEFPDAANRISTSSDWVPVLRRDYLPNIQQGIETWTLYHRKSH